MSQDFDPYYGWLGILPKEQPPNHYRLLKVDVFESDIEVISSAANLRMSHLSRFPLSEHPELSEKIVNEILAARMCLLNPQTKAEYDKQLHAVLIPEPPPVARIVKPPPVVTNRPLTSSDFEPASPRHNNKISRKRILSIIGVAGVSVAAAILLAFFALNQGDRKAEEQTIASTTQHLSTVVLKTEPEKTSNATLTEPSTPVSVPLKASPRTDDIAQAPKAPRMVAEKGSKEDPKAPTMTENKSSDLPGNPIQEAGVPSGKAKANAIKEPAASANNKRHEVPAPEVQKPFLDQVDEIYEPATHKKPAEKLELAKQLLLLGQKVDGDLNERYVLLSKSMELACEAGEAELMLVAADAIGKDFEIDCLDLKTKILLKLVGKGTPIADVEYLVASSLKTVDEALRAGRLDVAEQIVDLTSRVVKRKANSAFRKSVQQSRQKVQEYRDLWTRCEEAQSTLQKEPNDEDSNLSVGRWYWLAKNDWQEAAKYLAKGSNPQLRDVAKRELAVANLTVEEDVNLGDAWWTLGNASEGRERDAMMLRATHWYREAIGELKPGLVKARIEKRLSELAALETVAAGELAEIPSKSNDGLDSRSSKSKDMTRLPGKILPEKINDTLTLSRVGGPYKLMGTILISKGGKLLLERGVKVICAPQAKIAVDGQIKSFGEGEHFVSFVPGVAGFAWGGISIPQENKQEGGCLLERFEIRGANTGFDIDCQFEMKDCIIAQNTIGIKMQGRARRTIKNCAIVSNLKEGIDLSHATVDVDHCTIADNGEVGLFMPYEGVVMIKASEISGNAIGIKSYLYTTVVEIHASNIVRNRVAMEVRTKEQFQCSKNYWGTADARQIPQMMIDGRTKPNVGIVDFNPFEAKPIADAGCSFNKSNRIEAIETRIYLDDLEELSSFVGYGTLGKHGTGPEGNKSSLKGTPIAHSLAAHPPISGFSRVSYQLDHRYATFIATAALEDTAKPRRPLTFKVVGDGKLLWQSQPLIKAGDSQQCSVSVQKVKLLELQIECPGPHDWARGVWVEPYLLGPSKASPSKKIGQ